MSAQISNPIVTFAFAFGLLAFGSAISIPANNAFAVDCLAAPNTSAPPNSHWYYRTDRTRQSKCWYLRGNNETSEQRVAQVGREAPSVKPSQPGSTAGTYSLANFKVFVAQNVGAKLSDRDIEKLYTEFLEWNRRTKN
jgi:hypothetical protein